ncbi:MAG: helix-turn-helix domain-containing protein [Bacteroidota bacterium]
MKSLQNNFLLLCIWILTMGTVQGSEKIDFARRIQSLSTSKKLAQTDTMAVIAEKEKLVEMLLAKQEAFELKYFVLIGLVLFLVLLFGMLCFFRQRGDKRLDKIVSLLEKNQKSSANDDVVTKEKKLNIDPVIVNAILENLKAFEHEKGFINPKITLQTFAKKLHTNTKYLSKVINTYKLKSFRCYINDLRVQYSIEKLKNNSNYRNYTIQAMAKEVGFGNRESFSKAFRKKTGETVSNFLKQIS